MPENQDKIKLQFSSSISKPFAYCEQRTVSVSEFKIDVMRCVEQLAKSDGATLITTPGRYAFSVGLLASWIAGKSVILPPDKHPASREKIHQQHQIGLCCDHEWSQQFLENSANYQTKSDDSWSVDLPLQQTAVLLYTSGSTGRPIAVKKSLANLFTEANCLLSMFDWPKGAIVGTVPSQHLYGLTFTLMLPWLLGAPLVDQVPFFPQDVSKIIKSTNATTLISVPAHYKVLLQVPLNVKQMFYLSATAPLDSQTAINWSNTYQQQILEIYGSTETGIVGFRRQLEDVNWTVFPDVQIDVDEGLLKVLSAFIHPELGPQFKTADQVAVTGKNRFFLNGRADSIIKIAGKRISLIEIEQAIMSCSGVSDAAVIAACVDGHARDYAIWAAVVTQTNAVDSIAKIRLELGQKIEGTGIPKRFVVVNELPRNSNGKLMRQAVRELFISNEAINV